MPRPPYDESLENLGAPSGPITDDYLRGIDDAAALIQAWADASKGDMRHAYQLASVAILGIAKPQIPQFLKPKPYKPAASGSLPRGRHFPYW
jgi:hypothetical protein